MSAVAARLPDGRLHLQHGPIDLIVGAEGLGAQAAFAAAVVRFETVLEELVAELPALRSEGAPVSGTVARRMAVAVAPHRPAFVTPMAAVAGAVAEEVLAAMTGAGPLVRAYVNNGGDIALHLSGNAHFDIGIAGPGGAGLGVITLRAADPVRGIATSGRGGRSLSLGIADSVTVLAASAAAADAAATLIANAVDLPGHPAIRRVPATELRADTDLGDRSVPVEVGALSSADNKAALDRGAGHARGMMARGLIAGAALFLRGEARAEGVVLPLTA